MGLTSEPALAAARFGARPRKGVLLGLSGPRLSVVGTAALLLTFALFTAGLAGATVSAPVVLLLAASAFVPVAGQSAVEWLPVAGHWAVRRALHQDVYGARPLAPRPAGTLALPGDAAALRLHVDTLSGAAMVHDPHRNTLTASCVVAPPSFVLLGVEDQNRRVQNWGRLLASLARTGHVHSIQVLEQTSPDPGTAVADWWAGHGLHDGSWASQSYDEFVAAAAPSSARHRTTVSLSLDMRKAARAISRAGGGLRGAAVVLRSDMVSLHSALQTAELRPQHWLGEHELAGAIRSAYDPDMPSTTAGPGTQHIRLFGSERG